MKVFIENEAGYNKKNIFNEKTLDHIETIEVARAYPFPYGFILNTTGEDEDNVDVFVITDQKLKSGQIVECEPIGLMEQFEQSWNPAKSSIEETDHNVLAVLKGTTYYQISEETKGVLTEFVRHVFDTIKKNKTRVGRFLDKRSALKYIKEHED